MENIFLQGLLQGLRIETAQGFLNLAELATLNADQLDGVAIALAEELEKSGRRSFRNPGTAENKVTQLKLDIVVGLMNAKDEIAEAKKEASERRKRNATILALIEAKNQESLAGKTIEELTAMLEQ